MNKIKLEGIDKATIDVEQPEEITEVAESGGLLFLVLVIAAAAVGLHYFGVFTYQDLLALAQ